MATSDLDKLKLISSGDMVVYENKFGQIKRAIVEGFKTFGIGTGEYLSPGVLVSQAESEDDFPYAIPLRAILERRRNGNRFVF